MVVMLIQCSQVQNGFGVMQMVNKMEAQVEVSTLICHVLATLNQNLFQNVYAVGNGFGLT